MPRPYRYQHDSDQAYLLACLAHLDRKCPKNQLRRAELWAKWERPLTDAELQERVVALYARRAEWTEADHRAWAALGRMDVERSTNQHRQKGKKS